MTRENKKKAVLLFLCLSLLLIAGCNKDRDTVPTAETLSDEEIEASLKESLGDDAYIFLPKTYSNAVMGATVNGVDFTVGTNSEDKQGGFYINPTCKSYANIGYYISADKGRLDYNRWYTDASDGNYYLPDILYSDRIDCTYISDEDYGIKWQEDVSVTGDVGDTCITIRAVNLGSGDYIGTFYINLALDKENLNYSIDKVTPLQEDTTGIKDIALSYAEELLQGYDALSLGKAYTERVDQCYFYKVIKKDGYTVYADALKDKNDFLYASTVPFEYGYTTIYLSGDKEILGYDALYPFNEDSIVAPRSYFEVY